MKLLQAFAVLSSVLGPGLGCFITNCPVGGKRSDPSFGLMQYSNDYRRCPPCGPGLSGQCFGPHICCNADSCLIDPVNLGTCKREALKMKPCSLNRPRCGPDNRGHCALNKLCCTADGCTADESCGVKDHDVIRESLMII